MAWHSLGWIAGKASAMSFLSRLSGCSSGIQNDEFCITNHELKLMNQNDEFWVLKLIIWLFLSSFEESGAILHKK